jgi:shikimate kinase
MSHKKIIAIIGLMGVGKSTIGAKLAERTKSYFLDCDSEIEDLEKLSIKEIFAKNGEKYFREIEKKIIRNIVLRDEPMILSLGGGAFMDQDTRILLKEKAITVWLQASIETILYRVGNKDTRPLLNQKNKREILEELIIKRYPTYCEADLKFDTNNINHDLLVTKIIREIKLLQNDK